MSSSSQETNSTQDSLTSRMTELLTKMVAGLVDNQDAIHVEADETESGTTLRLYVAPDDLGKVIGKQGRTARSLRTILSAIGSKANHRLALDVLEDDEDDEDGEEEA